MKQQFTELIVNRLNGQQSALMQAFNATHSIKVARHFVLDDLLPLELAHQISDAFPAPKKMRSLHSYGEIKMKYSAIKHTAPIIQALHQAIQDPRVVACIEAITGIPHQLPDTSRIAGGVSALLKGHYLNPHLDNSHNIDRTQYRTVNLLYYISPDWTLENGGNYELWNETVTERLIVPSLFNRLLVMETTPTSWHAVNPVRCHAPRRCIFNYYFSEHSPTGKPYFFGGNAVFYNPLFKPRPEQTFRRAFVQARDALLGLLQTR